MKLLKKMGIVYSDVSRKLFLVLKSTMQNPWEKMGERYKLVFSYHVGNAIELLHTNYDATESSMGSEVEILAASAILETDIYVAVEFNDSNEGSSYGIHQKNITWRRYNASDSYYSSFAIYIANFRDHYEPVISLINSGCLHLR